MKLFIQLIQIFLVLVNLVIYELLMRKQTET